MNDAIEFLDAAKAKLGGISDYAIAPILGVTRSQISLYRNKKQSFSDEMCLKVASILEIEPFIVLAAIHAERATTEPEKAAWKAAIEKFGGYAAAIVAGIMLNALNPAPASASVALAPITTTGGVALSIHYAK